MQMAAEGASVIPSLAEHGEGPPARELVTQITLAAPRIAAVSDSLAVIFDCLL